MRRYLKQSDWHGRCRWCRWCLALPWAAMGPAAAATAATAATREGEKQIGIGKRHVEGLLFLIYYFYLIFCQNYGSPFC